MKKTEMRISTQEYFTAAHGAKCSEVELKLEAALDKIDDLENRSRQCNIRTFGLPEGREGANPVSFFKAWLPELVNVSLKGGAVKIDFCHWVLARLPSPA